MKKKILITGCAGFIGFYLAKKLLDQNKYYVYGIDNLNSYYDVNLKKNRLTELKKNKNFTFFKIDIYNKKKILRNFIKHKYTYIFHLAAQAGVRYSIKNPETYLKSNIVGFFNILEASRIVKPDKLFFGSSSSVYGDQKKFPINENFNTDHPKSFYAATKKSNEVMAHAYTAIYNLKIIGFRFFTVYGPYGRPDMTPYNFLDSFFNNQKIKVFNFGKNERDYTYIDDVIELIIRLFEKVKNKKFKSKYEVYNIGNNKPERLSKYVKLLEKEVGKKIPKKFIVRQAGDVKKTFANIKKIFLLTNYHPKVSINMGLKNFVSWYKKYKKK